MTSRRLSATILLTSVFLSAAACGQKSSGSADKGDGTGTPIVMGRFVGPFIMQVGLGANAFNDISLKATDIESGPTALPLIVRGSLSGADGISEPPLVTAFERDLPVKIVWATNVSPHALLTRPGITTPSDLRGKKIAAPGGSILQVELTQYLTKQGMSLHDIRFVDLDAASIVSSYKSGAIDGAYLWQPQASTVEGMGAHALVRSSGTSFDIFSKKFIDQHPKAVQAFVCDMAKVQTNFLANPKSSWNALATQLNLESKLVPKLLPKDAVYAPDKISQGVLGPDGEVVSRIVSAGKAMVTLGQADKAPTAADVRSMIGRRFADGVTKGACSS